MSRSLIFQGIFLLFIILSLANTGCSHLPTWMGGRQAEVAETPVKAPSEIPEQSFVTFSENPTILETTNRKYKRMTRSRLEEESQLQSDAGSLWVNEGQGAYLFAQNNSRREGDVLNIRVEGAAQKQVETKVSVIKDLLKQLDEQQKKSEQAPLASTPDSGGGRAPAATEKGKPAKDEDKFELTAVPTRIAEKLADGNYRLKGQQPFMIGKREYKVIVTGIIRPEDFNDSGISSEKLLDPQFDVVSIRRATK